MFRVVASSWKRFGLSPVVHDMRWRDQQQKFRSALNSLITQIDSLHAGGGIISLVGTSAGGSAVLNAFARRSEKIHRAVNICGRLRAGEHVYPTLDAASRSSASFRESVELFERTEPRLSKKEREKILTIRALYDETVPVSTIPVDGATNIQITLVEHNLTIAAAMTVYSKRIANFLYPRVVEDR